MKLSDIKGEAALDVLAEVIEPAVEIMADPIIKQLAADDAPKVKFLKPIIKGHKKEIIQIVEDPPKKKKDPEPEKKEKPDEEEREKPVKPAKKKPEKKQPEKPQEKAADVLRYSRAKGDFLPCGEKKAELGGARTEVDRESFRVLLANQIRVRSEDG